MGRHTATIDNEICYVEGPDGRFEVGPITKIVDLIGGKTYSVEYDDKAAQYPWLSTDKDGMLSFEVRDAIEGMGFEETFVDQLQNTPLTELNDEGVPHRLAFFADMVTQMWDPSRTD